MSTTTPTLGLVKPATGDAPSTLRTAIGTNADALDTAVLTGDARLLSAALQAALAGTSGTPGSGNKFVTAADIGVGVQAHDADLDALAALTTTSTGRSLLAAADAAALRTILALGTAATSATAAFDAAGAAAAAQAASQPLDSDLTAIAALATTSYGRSLLTAAAASAMPGGEIGYDQVTSNVTVASNSEASGTTVITCAAHTFDGAPVIAEFFAPEAIYAAGDKIIVSLFEGGTQIGRLAVIGDGAANVTAWSVNGKLRFTPSAASHTYTVTAFRASSNGTIFAGAGGTNAVVPAFVRFTKA